MSISELQKSPQWGLNLSDEICFWCSAKTGRKVIHGYLENDAKAPESHYRDYKPCGACEGIMSQGVTFVQCSSEPNDNLKLADGSYPTGVWLVMKEDWVRKVFKPEVAEKIIKDKAVNIPVPLWLKLGLPNIKSTLTIGAELKYTETKIN